MKKIRGYHEASWRGYKLMRRVNKWLGMGGTWSAIWKSLDRQPKK